jgi:predicted trehalose synthase
VNLDRRWWVAIAVVVVVAIALVLSQTVFNRPSEECRPVVDILEFNKAQGELIGSKHSDEDPAVPTVADDAAYQQWADGLAQRAQKVNDPDLAASAIRLADMATQFVTKLPRLRAESVPGTPVPPVAYEMDALNKRILEELDALSKACT